MPFAMPSPHQAPTPSRDRARGPWLALGVVFLVGVLLRTIQALGIVSLCRDEVALALNLDTRGLGGLLLQPLDHHQMAPPGFLVLVEATTRLAGADRAPDLAFRFAPWLFGLLGLFAAWLLLRDLLPPTQSNPQQRWTLALALTPFALGTGVLYFSAAVKPYGAGLAACLLLTWASLRHLESPDDHRAAVRAGWLVGPLLLVSFPAVPLAACLALLLALQIWRSATSETLVARLRTWLHLVAPWGVFSAVSTLSVLRLRDRPVHDYMLDYWQSSFPDWSRPLEAAVWLPRHAAGVAQYFLFYLGPDMATHWLKLWMKASVAMLLLAAAWGVVVTVRRAPWRAAVLTMPLVVATLLAALHVYPFLERLGLWAAPSILVPAALGFAHLAGRNGLRLPVALGTAFVLGPIVLSTFYVQTPPTVTQALWPVIRDLASRVEPGDTIYVPCGGGQLGFRFYFERSGLGTADVDWVEGKCHVGPKGRPDRAGYFREANALAGRPRVWLFHSHRPRGRSEWVLERYLEVGELLDQIDDPEGRTGRGSTRVFLFDLRAANTGSILASPPDAG